jgi:hypothetical protein
VPQRQPDRPDRHGVVLEKSWHVRCDRLLGHIALKSQHRSYPGSGKLWAKGIEHTFYSSVTCTLTRAK